MPDREAVRITRERLNEYLRELAKEFRRLNGVKTPAEIILIGGAAVLASYGFRELTYDVDAVIVASSAMKDAIARVGEKFGLPYGWLNSDFRRTASYSDKLAEVSVYYKTYSNILTVRTVAAEYLLAMKLMSGRQYKNDLSDIVGVLLEHQNRGIPIARGAVDNAVAALYGADAVLPEASAQLLTAIYATNDYEALYRQVRDNELESRDLLLAFERESGKLTDENIVSVLRSARSSQKNGQKESVLALLEERKRIADEAKQSADIPDEQRRKTER